MWFKSKEDLIVVTEGPIHGTTKQGFSFEKVKKGHYFNLKIDGLTYHDERGAKVVTAFPSEGNQDWLKTHAVWEIRKEFEVEDYAMHKNPYLEACPPPKDVKQEIETLEQGISLARTWIDDLKSVLVDVQCKENEINNAKSKKDLRGKMGVK